VPYPGAVPRPEQGLLLCRPQQAVPLDVWAGSMQAVACMTPPTPWCNVLVEVVCQQLHVPHGWQPKQ
jgi:hypothetical protein